MLEEWRVDGGCSDYRAARGPVTFWDAPAHRLAEAARKEGFVMIDLEETN
jgi:hypothetical protein